MISRRTALQAGLAGSSTLALLAICGALTGKTTTYYDASDAAVIPAIEKAAKNGKAQVACTYGDNSGVNPEPSPGARATGAACEPEAPCVGVTGAASGSFIAVSSRQRAFHRMGWIAREQAVDAEASRVHGGSLVRLPARTTEDGPCSGTGPSRIRRRSRMKAVGCHVA